jgi:hypothetical protein
VGEKILPLNFLKKKREMHMIFDIKEMMADGCIEE